MFKPLWPTILTSVLIVTGCSEPGNPTSEAAGQSQELTTSDDSLSPSELRNFAEGISSTGTVYRPNFERPDKALVIPANKGEPSSYSKNNGGAPFAFNPDVADGDDFEAIMALPALTVEGPVAARPMPVAEAIFGNVDDREAVNDTSSFPSRVQTLIAFPDARCSGVLIAKDLVLTAGHCVHYQINAQSQPKWQTTATVFPARNGQAAPFGSCTASKFYSLKGWVEQRNTSFDFGAIKLDCSIGETVGWMGIYHAPGGLDDSQALIAGYPIDKPLTQWIDRTKPVARYSALTTHYLTDTKKGNSGSPVYTQSKAPAQCAGPCAHSVHTYADTDGNFGARINASRFRHLQSWIAE